MPTLKAAVMDPFIASIAKNNLGVFYLDWALRGRGLIKNNSDEYYYICHQRMESPYITLEDLMKMSEEDLSEIETLDFCFMGENSRQAAFKSMERFELGDYLTEVDFPTQFYGTMREALWGVRFNLESYYSDKGSNLFEDMKKAKDLYDQLMDLHKDSEVA